jgi:hypothetical protein
VRRWSGPVTAQTAPRRETAWMWRRRRNGFCTGTYERAQRTLRDRSTWLRTGIPNRVTYRLGGNTQQLAFRFKEIRYFVYAYVKDTYSLI